MQDYELLDTARHLASCDLIPPTRQNELKAGIRKTEEAQQFEYHMELTEDDTFVWVAKPVAQDLSKDALVSDQVVGRNLTIWRKYNNLTQSEVGSKIGCSQQAYQKYEKGTRSLPIDLLAKLSRLFNIPMEQLVYPQRGLRDIPRYKPHAKISKNIHVVEVLSYDGIQTITRGEFAPITYEKLYGILDGRNRSHSPVGYATAANGDMVLLVTCTDFPYEADTWTGKNRMTIEKLEAMDAEEKERYIEEFLECKTDAIIDDEQKLSRLSSECTLYDPDGGSRQQIEYVADDLSVAKAELSLLNAQIFNEIVNNRRD